MNTKVLVGFLAGAMTALVASYLVTPGGQAVPENLADLLAGLDDRRFHAHGAAPFEKGWRRSIPLA